MILNRNMESGTICMKKKIIVICVVIFSLMLGTSIFISINKSNKDDDEYVYQKIAWEALNKSSKQEVIGSWKNAKVETVTMDNDFGIISLNKSIGGQINIKGKEMKVVSFHSKNETKLGKVIIYIDSQTRKAVGIVPRM
jgi:hypothetical protein